MIAFYIVRNAAPYSDAPLVPMIESSSSVALHESPAAPF
jgi:hypothetical protein